MRIALVHGFYSSAQPSGENRVVEDQARKLAQEGHEVALISTSTDQEQQRFFYELRAAGRVVSRSGVNLMNQVHDFAPDILHVHNTFPNLGSRWLRRVTVPTVMTIHNFRIACSNGLLLREGVICHDCWEPRHRWLPAIRSGCYRDSRVATVPVALSRTGFRKDIELGLDVAITISEASTERFRNITANRIPTRLIPNFVEDHLGERNPSTEGRAGWILVARLSAEKGVLELVRSWPHDVPLTVIGSGPDEQAISEEVAKRPQISIRPSLPRDEVRRLFDDHLGLVMPSRWHEVAPQVVVEAASAGLPVVAFEVNDVARLVEESGAGLGYSTDEGLERALSLIADDWFGYSQRARELYEREWRPEIWLERTISLYSELTQRDSISHLPQA